MTDGAGRDSIAGPVGGMHRLTTADLAMLGIDAFAYVRRVLDDKGHEAWAVHAADGSPMAIMADREVAFAAVRQHDLEPLSVH